MAHALPCFKGSVQCKLLQYDCSRRVAVCKQRHRASSVLSWSSADFTILGERYRTCAWHYCWILAYVLVAGTWSRNFLEVATIVVNRPAIEYSKRKSVVSHFLHSVHSRKSAMRFAFSLIMSKYECSYAMCQIGDRKVISNVSNHFITFSWI